MHHHSDSDFSWEASERTSSIYEQIDEKDYKQKFPPLSFIIIFVKTLEK